MVNVTRLPAGDEAPGGLRGRFRAQVQRDVKNEALRQLAAGGPQAVSVNAIAKKLGVSGPALYRYFANRDDLLDALILDAYLDLGEALRAEFERRSGDSPAGRLGALAHAYRDWALAQPHRYGLLLRPTLPGHDAHADDLVEAAHRCITPFFDVIAELPTVASPSVPDPLRRQLQEWAFRAGRSVSEYVAHRALVVWSRVHGFVDLELGGNYVSMGIDAEQLFNALVGELSS
jgi:AcrR family transcriptional regulator